MISLRTYKALEAADYYGWDDDKESKFGFDEDVIADEKYSERKDEVPLCKEKQEK